MCEQSIRTGVESSVHSRSSCNVCFNSVIAYGLKEGMCCRADSSDAHVPTQPASARHLLSDELEAVCGEGHKGEGYDGLPNSHGDASVVQADLLQRYAVTQPLCLPQ